MIYEAPKVVDYGSIASHTFHNDENGCTVPGVGPKGKNSNNPQLIPDCFNEPSHS